MGLNNNGIFFHFSVNKISAFDDELYELKIYTIDMCSANPLVQLGILNTSRCIHLDLGE